VTQGRPGRSEQKDFDVLWLCSRGRPDAYLSTIPDLEVRNVSDPDKGTLSRVLKQKSAGTFPDGGIPSLDLNRDIDITSIVHQRWHASEGDFRMREPPAEHVCVGGKCAQVSLYQQIFRPPDAD
jgi:hypothetical protein